MSKEWKLTGEQMKALVAFRPEVLNATVAYANLFPQTLREIGISPRPTPRFEYKGTTSTWPEPDRFVLGPAYVDHHDGLHDEDIFEVNTKRKVVIQHPPRRWEQEFPSYTNYHHGDKSYLDGLPPKL